MLNEEEELELERTIGTWLDTLPPDEDIVTYATGLSDEDAVVLFDAAESYLHILFQRKNHYFLTANCEELVQEVQVIDQLEALGNFARYSTSSVLQKLAKKYPSVGSLILPSDTSAWCSTFLSKVEVGLKALTAREFAESRLYLGSLQKTHDAAALLALKAKLEELFLEEGKAQDTGREVLQADIDQWRTFYGSLNFLPPQRVEELTKTEAYFDRLSFNFDLLDALTLLVDSDPTGDMEKALWHMERWRRLRDLVRDEESLRLARTEKGQATQNVYEQLNGIWTEESVVAGQTVLQTREVLARSAESTLPINLQDYFKTNLFIESCLDPLNPDVVIDNIAGASSDADAEIYITQVASSEGYDEQQRTLLKSLLHQVMALVRGIKTPAPTANEDPAIPSTTPNP